MVGSVFCAQPERPKIGFEDEVPVAHRRLARGCLRLDARVVHQHVDPSVLRDGVVDECLDLCGLAHIRSDERRVAAGRLDVVDHGPTAVAGAPGHHDGSPSAAKRRATPSPIPRVDPVTTATVSACLFATAFSVGLPDDIHTLVMP